MKRMNTVITYTITQLSKFKRLHNKQNARKNRD